MATEECSGIPLFTRLDLIIAAKRRGAWEQAETLAREALAADPGHVALRAHLADIMAHRGDAEEALLLVTAVLRDRPDYGPALLVRGYALQRLRRGMEAEAAYAAAWSAAPSGYAAACLATARARSQGPEAALDFVRQAGLDFGDHAGLRRTEAMLLEALGRHSEAIAVYRRVLESRPGDDRAFARLIRASLACRAPSEALAELDGLLRLPSRAGNRQLLIVRAELLERATRDVEAVACWEAVLKADPANAYVRRRLAYICRRRGDLRRAFDLLKGLLLADPADPAVLGAFVADARALGRRREGVAFLVALLRRHPARRSLWGWIRRLSTDPSRSGGPGEKSGCRGPSRGGVGRPAPASAPAPPPRPLGSGGLRREAAASPAHASPRQGGGGSR